MKNKKFIGMGVAMVTPFTEDNKIDLVGLQKLSEYLIDNGTDYLVVQGTTGETPTLSKSEKRMTLDLVLEVNNGRLPIVLGMGGYSTSDLQKELKTWNFDGVDAILSVTPFYNKPNQKGIYHHYKMVSESSPVPIIMYNVPSRTGVNMNWETTVSLAEDHANIIAIKEASGDMVQMMNVIKNKPDDLLVISGDDAITLPIIASGGDGVISVVGNGFPREFSSMVKQALNGDLEKANQAHYKMLNIIQAIFEEGNPAGIKEVLRVKKLCGSHLRLPLVNASSMLVDKIDRLMSDFELITL